MSLVGQMFYCKDDRIMKRERKLLRES